MANLIWEYENIVINKPLNLGALEHLTETTEYEIRIKHDSEKEISQCGFYISPYTGDYFGSKTALKDYERVLWLADNYEGFGLSIRQEYEVTGQINAHDGIRIVDYDRDERVDIFAGATIKMMSGDAVNETAIIESFNPDTKVILLRTNFSKDVTGANYKINIDKTTFFKLGQGVDYTTMIPLIYKGGTIERLDSTVVKIKLRIPKFAQSAGSYLFDLNMKFVSLEEE